MIGILVMAYGGSDNLDEVEPYLLGVRGYRPSAPTIIYEVRGRYRQIGGRSPILERLLRKRILEWINPYTGELRATIAAMMERLGPDAGQVIATVTGKGHKNNLLAPVGLVCEHVEILYDVDVMLKRQAQALGVRLERIEMLNTAPAMIARRASLVRARAAEAGWL